MIKADELLFRPTPLYSEKKKKPPRRSVYNQWPADRDGERFCGGCGWQALLMFKDYGAGRRHWCRSCEVKRWDKRSGEIREGMRKAKGKP